MAKMATTISNSIRVKAVDVKLYTLYEMLFIMSMPSCKNNTVILFSGVSFQECSGFSVQCSASEILMHADIILWKHILGHFEASGTRIKEYQGISNSYAEL